MKFAYTYRTSDNQLHEGEIDAKSRDDAYAALKARGVRPARMEAHKLPWWRSLSFRWIVIVLLSVAIVVLVIADIGQLPERDSAMVTPVSRRQIWGDRAIIERCVSDNWGAVFSNPAERLLAAYSQPGAHVSTPSVPATITLDFDTALKECSRNRPDDLEEYRQVRAIVEGMKQELREYLRDGGSYVGYVARLSERQASEEEFVRVERARLEEIAERASAGELSEEWNRANRRLRDMGIRGVEYPQAKKNRR